MTASKVYTVSQLSKLAGISVRTLHYYDQIGLLKAIRREDNGFREYTDNHVVQLQQILLYRELDFSIEKIRKILTCDRYDLLDAFEDQKLMLLERIHQAQTMINGIEATISNIRGKVNGDIIFGAIPKDKIERWNRIRLNQNSSTISDTMTQILGDLSESEAKHYFEQSELFNDKYSKLLELPIESKIVQEHIMEHYAIMNSFLYRVHDNFTGIGHKGYLLFADQLLSDQVTYEFHEHYSPGLSAHLNMAMIYFAENTLKDNLDELRNVGTNTRVS